MSEIRILIVEDDPLIAEEIRQSLDELDYQVCGKAYTPANALRQLDIQRPDLVLLDINLAGGAEGLDIAAAINHLYRIPFVFLTSYADRATLDRAKLLEPAGYIVKPFTEKDLLAGLEIALYNFARRHHQHFLRLDREQINRHLLSGLTQREFDLLKLIWEGYTNQQMAVQLFVSVNTIKTHLKNLYLKLGATSRTTALQRIRSLVK
jgi:DNA-binding NarL/FixJ family response regulator